MIVTEKLGAFTTVRKARNSIHIPLIDTLSTIRLVTMFQKGTLISVYKTKLKNLIILELPKFNHTRLNIDATEYLWTIFMTKHKERLQHIYKAMARRLADSNDLKTMVALKPACGTIVAASEDIIVPDEYRIDQTMVHLVQMDHWPHLVKLYNQLEADGGLLVYDELCKPHILWQSKLDVIIMLAGVPYSRYIDKEPYNVDFWLQLQQTAPEIYGTAIKREHLDLERTIRDIEIVGIQLISAVDKGGRSNEHTKNRLIPAG